MDDGRAADSRAPAPPVARPAGVPVSSLIYVLIYNLVALIMLVGIAILAARGLAATVGWPAAMGVVGLIVLPLAAGYAWAYALMRIRERLFVRRAREDLFRLIVDAYLQPDAPGSVATRRVVTREPATLGPGGVGTTWQEVAEQNGRRVVRQYMVTAYELNRRFAISVRTPAASGWQSQASWVLDPAPEGTRVTGTWVLRPRGTWRLVAPFMVHRYRVQLRAQMAQMQKRLEA